MAKKTVYIEDVGGRFKALFTQGPKVFRQNLGGAIKLSAFGLGQRMKAKAPRSEAQYAPHIQDEIEVAARGLSARVGILDQGPTGMEADIAVYNEYAPNKQPFMRPSAEAHESEFVRDITRALKVAERQLGGFGGGLQ